MTLKRTLLAVACFGIAAVVIAVPVDLNLPFATQQIFVVGLVVLAVGALYLLSGEATSASPPNPEQPANLPAPGETIEEQLETLSRTPFRPNAKRTWKDTRDEVYTYLRSLAVSTLAERYNLTEREATELLESGTWSEDTQAVAFFRTTSGDGSARTGPTTMSSEVGEQAKHVIDELGAIERGERLLPDEAVRGSETAREAGRTPNESHNAGEST